MHIDGCRQTTFQDSTQILIFLLLLVLKCAMKWQATSFTRYQYITMYIGLLIFVPQFCTDYCLQTLEMLLQCTQIVCNNLVKSQLTWYFWQTIADYFLKFVNSSHSYVTGGTSSSEFWWVWIWFLKLKASDRAWMLQFYIVLLKS